MILLNNQSKVFVAIDPIDFRKGIRGLKATCKDILRQSPDSGVFFLFRNKSMTCIKILVYDGQGFWLMLKRLSKGKFPWWPEGMGKGKELDYRQLQLLVNAAQIAEYGEDWKKVF